jgi:hypothetical protein
MYNASVSVVNSEVAGLAPEANPTIASYHATVSLAHFKTTKIYFTTF